MKGVPSLADIFMGRTDNIGIRYAAGLGLLYNVFMVFVAVISILFTVPKAALKSK